MAMHSFLDTAKNCGGEADPEEARRQMMSMMGPQAVDQAVRSAINLCWMLLPEEKRSIENVEVEIRRLMDRALDNLRTDCQAFGIPPQGALKSAKKARGK